MASVICQESEGGTAEDEVRFFAKSAKIPVFLGPTVDISAKNRIKL
jgi:hypothetical protein